MLKIRSRYIIKQIFDNIIERRYLSIVKYNKKHQNILNLSIKNYKIYNQIEIELIPISNYEKGDIFINRDNEDNDFIHIYINNNKTKEYKYCTFEYKSKISKIRILIDNEIKSFKGLCKDCECLKELNIVKCNRKNIIDMSEMFCGCTNLEKLNLLNLKTDKVTDMSYMFSGCLYLKELNLKNFNASGVTNMKNMFEECSNLRQLNLNNFNTSNVVYMNDMFSECYDLDSIKIENFNTSKVKKMSRMFNNCSNLIKLNLNNFDTSNVNDMSSMFSKCSDLIELDISNFNIKKNANVIYMFSECKLELKNKIKTQIKKISKKAFEIKKKIIWVSGKFLFI